MSTIKEDKWFQPTYLPQHLLYLRGLDVGNIVVHALYESSDYDKELDDVGLTHRNTVNGTNPPWPSLSSDHKGVHRGNPGGTAPDAATMEALGVDTYNVIGGSLTAPCTDEFAENHNTETPSLQYSKALYQEFVDNNGVTSPNQVGIYGGYGRFNSNKLFPFTAIRRGYFTQLRDSFSTQIKAKKGVNDDGDLIDTFYTNETYSGKTLYDVSNMNYTVYPHISDGFHPNNDTVLNMILGIEKVGIGFPDRNICLFATSYSEITDTAIDKSVKGYSYKFSNGRLELGNLSTQYTPSSVGVSIGFFAKLLMKDAFIWDAEQLINADITTMDATGFDFRTWIDNSNTVTTYTGTGDQPVLNQGSGSSRFPRQRNYTYLDALMQGFRKYNQIKQYCTNIYHAIFTLDGVTYTPVTGTQGYKVSRFGVANIGGTTIIDNIQYARGICLVLETVGLGIVIVYYNKNLKRGVTKNISVSYGGNNYPVVANSNDVIIEVFPAGGTTLSTTSTTTGTTNSTTSTITTTLYEGGELEGSIIIT